MRKGDTGVEFQKSPGSKISCDPFKILICKMNSFVSKCFWQDKVTDIATLVRSEHKYYEHFHDTGTSSVVQPCSPHREKIL